MFVHEGQSLRDIKMTNESLPNVCTLHAIVCTLKLRCAVRGKRKSGDVDHFKMFRVIPHINTRWRHSDAKSYGSSLELRRDPRINKLLVTYR